MPSSSFTKFNVLVENLPAKVLDLFGSNPGTDCDVLKLMLVNSPAPTATDSVKGNLTEITATGGYGAGGSTITNQAGTRATGTFTLAGDQVVWAGSGAGFGPFQYPVLYDDTPTSPADPLIGFWNYGTPISVGDGETFTVRFNSQASGGTILTLT